MDLDLFVYPNWRSRIRPAGSKRDWMEATPERFAYRCLPLAIANAHGWEIGSPCGFEARWNGGGGSDAVEVRPDPGTEPRYAPVSLFGQGTVTFHIEAIVRTPPGWNLFVGGSPNAAKDGIAPLGGVIETDWSPYTFTMNWRFTRPGHWVRFEEDEPICFFFPVQRGLLETVEPRIRPLDEAPELRDAFEQWSASRNAFQAWVEETKPSAPADRWQKLYYRGLNPDESTGAADHQNKLRVPALVSEHGFACPVTGAAARPEAKDRQLPDTDSALMDAAATDIAAATMVVSQTPEACEPAPPAMPATGSTAAAPAAAASAAAPTAAADDVRRALLQREWLLSIVERQRALSPATANIAGVRDISSQDFLDYFYAPSRPVLLSGEVADWPVLDRWTPAYLADTVGDAEVEFQGGRGTNRDFELDKDRHKRTLPFRRFIEEATAGGAGNELYITAYNSGRNAAALAPLQRELGALDKFLTPDPGMMWIGPEGTFTPLHYDLTNNLLVQLVGTKRLHLVSPSETGKLYNRRHVFSDVHDLTDPACIRDHPLVAGAMAFEVVLNPGDALFIPVGWWHQVRSEAFSVMMTYTNFLWPNDAHASFPG